MGMKSFGVGISVKSNVEAVEFYKKVFGLETGILDLFPEGHPYYGAYQHAELVKDGKVVFCVQSLEHELYDFDAEKQIINFGVYFDDEFELREAFNQLREGGIVKEPFHSEPWSQLCATVIDKYGISWWISI